jgi:hypothetical protein
MLDQSNLSVQRCRLIFWVEYSVGGYLALATIYIRLVRALPYTSLINKRVKKAPQVCASKLTTRWRCMYEGLSFMSFE